MDVFCLPPRPASRWMQRVFVCGLTIMLAALAHAQSSSSSDSQINNPKTGTVSTGNYIPPAPPHGPDVYYDRPWDVYAGMGYTNFLAGPALIQRSNLGGWEAAGSYWLNWHWGMLADSRMYIGTSGVYPSDIPQPVGRITGPRIMQYYFMAGPEYRFLRRGKGSMTMHAIFGNTYGIYDAATLHGANVTQFGLFPTQWTFAGAVGGTYDYNYTPRLAWRVQSEVLLTHYGSNDPANYGGTSQQNFAFSVGLLVRMGHVNKARFQEHGAQLWPHRLRFWPRRKNKKN